MTNRPDLGSALALAFSLSLVACGTNEAGPPTVADTKADALVEEDGVESGLPPLDAAACPTVTGDEAPRSFSRDYVPLASGSIEQDKAFYLATVLEQAPGVMDAIATDATLAAIAKDRDARFRTAASTCDGKLACIVEALSWKDVDADAAADALVARLVSAGILDLVVRAHLRPSGMFNLHAADADDVLVRDAFHDTVVAWNGALSSIGGEPTAEKIAAAMRAAAADNPSPLPFHRPIQIVVLAMLSAAGRDEATRYEPLMKGQNAKALARIPGIDFGAFPFVAIVVPGLGPNTLDTPLSEGGRDRCDLAAERFAAKLAPLIVLSGGHVHPDRTPYSEAIEMKKYLMITRGIPEDALLVDPHARHTTTNLRNVSRLFFRSGVPIDRPALVTTDLGQTLYMQATGFPIRNDKELGYRPWRVLFQLSSFDTCLVPTRLSLQADGRDPLDP